MTVTFGMDFLKYRLTQDDLGRAALAVVALFLGLPFAFASVFTFPLALLWLAGYISATYIQSFGALLKALLLDAPRRLTSPPAGYTTSLGNDFASEPEHASLVEVLGRKQRPATHSEESRHHVRTRSGGAVLYGTSDWYGLRTRSSGVPLSSLNTPKSRKPVRAPMVGFTPLDRGGLTVHRAAAW